MKNNLTEAMTADEVKVFEQLQHKLRVDGFNTFANYLQQFHINFLTSEQAHKPFVAAISRELGIIFINPDVSINAADFVLLHEMGHKIMKHNEHLLAKLKALGIDTPSKLAHELSNIVGDYEISNQMYHGDPEFIAIAKNIQIKNPDGTWYSFPGLVTELDFPDHPEYVNMNFDQLFDIFVKKYNLDQLNADAAAAAQPGDQPSYSQDYKDGWNAVMKAFRAGEITKEQLRDFVARKAMWKPEEGEN